MRTVGACGRRCWVAENGRGIPRENVRLVARAARGSWNNNSNNLASSNRNNNYPSNVMTHRTSKIIHQQSEISAGKLQFVERATLAPAF